MAVWRLAQQLFVMAFREELLHRQFPGDHARLDVVLAFLASQDIECVRELAGVFCEAFVLRMCVCVRGVGLPRYTTDAVVRWVSRAVG